MPKLPPKNPHDALADLIRQLGFDPAKARVITLDPETQRPDNVIPFPKSGNRFGGRPTPPRHATDGRTRGVRGGTVTPSHTVNDVLDLLDTATEMAASGDATGAIVLLYDSNGLGILSTGINRYEAIGMMKDAEHELICEIHTGGHGPEVA